MRNQLTVVLVALAATSAWCGGVAAAGRDPLVIQGIGPQDAGDSVQPSIRSRRQAHGHPAGTQLANAQSRGQYGGGFIEFLITGGGSSAPAPAPVQRNYRPVYRNAAPAEPVRRPRVRYQQEAFATPEPSFRRNLPKVVDSKFNRQEVAYASNHTRGTIVVDTPNRFLYYVLGNGRAMRYGIGVGRPGFEWSGVKKITRKAEWPSWRPPSEMLKRRPDLPKFMEGGPSNPLGARAMYLGSSLYRIHGTNEPNTIGTNVSSGCIRLMNKDVNDLYQRARVGTKVVVI